MGHFTRVITHSGMSKLGAVAGLILELRQKSGSQPSRVDQTRCVVSTPNLMILSLDAEALLSCSLSLGAVAQVILAHRQA